MPLTKKQRQIFEKYYHAFRLWNIDKAHWITERFDRYIHFSWNLPASGEPPSCWFEVNEGNKDDIKIVWPDENGNFVPR